jgi:ParB-like chromosome segregation protein Spo0J
VGSGGKQVKISIADIYISPERQRQDIDPAYIESLAHSISTVGLIHPILVEWLAVGALEDGTVNTFQFALVAGECRIKAHRALVLLEI